uniref:Protein FAM160A1-like isoform X1 n=2 Tax=Hirondellea gigas TaxID=1518452 RepID=A0A6A7FY64_9CRUS
MSAVAGSNGNNNGVSSTVGGWLRNSVARSSFGRRASAAAATASSSSWKATPVAAAGSWLGVGAELSKVDPAAAYHTFNKHWQQTLEIMEQTKLQKQVSQDDVTGVINHLGQMVTLLQVDIRQIMTKDRPPAQDADKIASNSTARTTTSSESPNVCTTSFSASGQSSTAVSSTASSKKPYIISSSSSGQPPLDPPPTPIFDHFLGEEILDKVLDWSLSTGEFANTLKLEQLRVHEVLLSQSRQELLVYKPVIRPLIRLLDSCLTCIPVEVERHLVLLLNQLCASLLHNQQLLHFFFLSSPNEQGQAKFLIFSLLLPFVHREGDVGQQARDALLLCMALSNTHPPVGRYIAGRSNFCPILAAGMCGLYSTLPRVLPQSVSGGEGWHCIARSDICLVPNLQVFLNSLEFCNAVVQVAHPRVRNELVELLYHGFLSMVLGPALHQDGAVSELQQDLSAPPANIDEVVTTTAYVELFLSYATEPQLRRAFLAFLLSAPPHRGKNNGTASREPPVVNTLISRLHSQNTRVCLVTLQLFRRILDCWCEDVMLVLVFQYLVSGSHVMLSHRTTASHHPPPTHVDRILDLMPTVLTHEEECNLCNDANCSGGGGLTAAGAGPPYHALLQEARLKIRSTVEACEKWTWKYDGMSPSPAQSVGMLAAVKINSVLPYKNLKTKSRDSHDHSEEEEEEEEHENSSDEEDNNDVECDPLLHTTKRREQRRRRSSSLNASPISATVITCNNSSSSSSSSSSGDTPCGGSTSSNTATTTTATGLTTKSVVSRSSARKHQQIQHAGGSNSSSSSSSSSLLLTHPTILNLSNDDDAAQQPDSLGASSGYESFNIRSNSRDSSPSSPPNSPRSQHVLSPVFSTGRTATRDGRRASRQQQHRTTYAVAATVEEEEKEELDEEFLQELLGWDVVGTEEANSDLKPSKLEAPKVDTEHEEPNKSTENTKPTHESLTDTPEQAEKETSNSKTLDDDSQEGQCTPQVNTEGSRMRQQLEEAMQEIDSAFAAYAPSSPQHVAAQDCESEEVNWDEPEWSCPPSPPSTPPPPHSRPTIGPFLEAVIERVETILNSSVPVTQLLFSIILRLASCPAPILTSLLLHPAILCQPAVRSLYQVLSSVKQRIDACLTEDDAHLLSDARTWFAARHSGAGAGKQLLRQTEFEPIKMIAQHHLHTSGSSASATSQQQANRSGNNNSSSSSTASLFSLDQSKAPESRRRSIAAAVTGRMGALFKKNFSTTTTQQQQQDKRSKDEPLQHLPHNAGYRYFRQPSDNGNQSAGASDRASYGPSSNPASSTPQRPDTTATPLQSSSSSLPSTVSSSTPSGSGRSSFYHSPDGSTTASVSHDSLATSSLPTSSYYSHSTTQQRGSYYNYYADPLSTSSHSLNSSIHHNQQTQQFNNSIHQVHNTSGSSIHLQNTSGSYTSVPHSSDHQHEMMDSSSSSAFTPTNTEGRFLYPVHTSFNSSLSSGAGDSTTDAVMTSSASSSGPANVRRAVHSYNPAKVHAARCAVMLRQLLLELSALAQEHAVYTPVMIFDFRTPACAASLGANATERGRTKSGSSERSACGASRKNSVSGENASARTNLFQSEGSGGSQLYGDRSSKISSATKNTYQSLAT